jgi:3D (Asp-Asp-Asp) domain-containing protein
MAHRKICAFILVVVSISVLPALADAVMAGVGAAGSINEIAQENVPNQPIRSISASLGSPAFDGPSSHQCSDGWYVTGYFTPHESDYPGLRTSIRVEGKSYSFNAAFLRAVEIEGWGKTLAGDYIGHYDGAWHFSHAAMDAHGKALKNGAIAIDPMVIGFYKKVTIPTLPLGWGSKVFTTSDIGPGVRGKHIDVYTGEGKAAQAMTFKLTGRRQTVCIQ